MNYQIILRLVGVLLVLDGLFMTLGIPFSIYYGDDDVSTLFGCGLGLAAVGAIIVYATRKAQKEIKKREGYLIVCLGWIVMSMFGAIPFVVHGSIPSYTDAFFETMSGFTTTGASILNNIESLPHGMLFWRSITQWLGGMGMIVLSLAILPILGIGGMQLFVAEVPGPTKDKIHPRVAETAKRLWGIYVMLTFLEVVLLMFGGMNFFDAICHSFTTMATGGFSTKQDSIAYYQSPYIHYVITVFMFLAGVNFTLHYMALHKKFETVRKNEEFRFYTVLMIIFTLIIAAKLILDNYADVETSFRDSLFQIVSLITTTGFITADYESWGSFYKVFFFLLLFVGGCAGSTGGGIKIVRHLLLMKNSVLELRRLIHPRAVIPVRFNTRAVSPEIVSHILAFFLFYVSIFAISSLLMAIIGVDFETAIGSVATSLGNVGPAIGSVGPVNNFAHLPDPGKWLLSFLMMMGRLELFTVLLIFSRAFWKR